MVALCYLIVCRSIPRRDLRGIRDAAFEAVGAEGSQGDGCCAGEGAEEPEGGGHFDREDSDAIVLDVCIDCRFYGRSMAYSMSSTQPA